LNQLYDQTDELVLGIGEAQPNSERSELSRNQRGEREQSER